MYFRKLCEIDSVRGVMQQEKYLSNAAGYVWNAFSLKLQVKQNLHSIRNNALDDTFPSARFAKKKEIWIFIIKMYLISIKTHCLTLLFCLYFTQFSGCCIYAHDCGLYCRIWKSLSNISATLYQIRVQFPAAKSKFKFFDIHTMPRYCLFCLRMEVKWEKEKEASTDWRWLSWKFLRWKFCG